MDTRGTLYDGITAYPHPVSVRFPSGGWMVVTTDEGHAQSIPVDQLTRTHDGGITVRLGRSDVPGWRLILQQPIDPDLAASLPGSSRYGGWIDQIGLGKAALAFGAIAAAVVAIGYSAPAWLAPLIPPSWERNLGDAIVGDFGELRCRNPDGQRALEAMVERVAPGATKQGEGQIRVAALDVDMFNAAALPGGHVVVFKTAVTETRSPDELAGIMAHEVAHVRRRHVTQALVRELGIGALIRTFAGGLGANAQQVVSLSYTRANEAEADADAIAALRRAGVDPRPTAALFKRLAGEDGVDSGYAAEWLSSHPQSSARAQRFAASYDPKMTYRPVLNQAQSDQLFNICWKGPLKPAASPR